MTTACVNCGKGARGNTWRPGEVLVHRSVYACSVACAEAWGMSCAPGFRPGEPGWCIEVEPVPSSPMTIELADVQDLHRKHPAFWAPDLDDLERIEVGMFVQLGFVFETGVERMWVEVTGRRGHGWSGRLRNKPAAPSPPVRWGDEVAFEPRHVHDVSSERFGERSTLIR